MKVLISGASGLVGKALARRLQEDGHTISRLVRPGGRNSSPADIFWDPMAATVDAPAMEGFDAVVHLSGANIAGGRWTPERKAVLRSSRIDSDACAGGHAFGPQKKTARFPLRLGNRILRKSRR